MPSGISVVTACVWPGGFLSYLRSPCDYDEPEILRCSSHAFCPIGPEPGHCSAAIIGWKREEARRPCAMTPPHPSTSVDKGDCRFSINVFIARYPSSKKQLLSVSVPRGKKVEVWSSNGKRVAITILLWRFLQ